MQFLISFLILILDLVILGAIYWGVTTILNAMPFIPAEAKTILLVVIKVIVVIVALVWVISWLIAVLGGAGFSLPTFVPWHRPVTR